MSEIRRSAVVLSLAAVVASAGLAQIVVIKDGETGLSLETATLVSEDPRAFTTTNAKGEADISAFKGSKKIEIRFLGYKTEIKSYAELEAAGFVVSLIPSVLSLDQVVVSATRWNRPSMDIPARITTLSARTLFLQNPQTAADLLGTSGEVFIQKSQQGGGSPMIRGFATNRLLYSVDGVRMNTAIFRSGNLQNVISLDPFALENTEVLFGPGSVIYGSDAIGGVMSFHTLAPQLSLSGTTLIKGKAEARSSSANDERTVHVDLNAGWHKFAALTSISLFDFGDLTMGRNGPVEYLRRSYVRRRDTADVVEVNNDPRIQRPTGYRQINLMEKLRFRPDQRWDLQYGFHYSSTTDIPRYDRLILFRAGLPKSAEWNYGSQVWMMNHLSVSHTAAGNFFDQATVRLAHQLFKESRIDRDMNDPERRTRVEKVNAFSVNVDFAKTLAAGQELTYGFEVVHNDVASSGTNEEITSGSVIKGPTRYPQSTWSSYAGYATFQYRISTVWLVQSGLRYNRFALDADFDTTFYPFPYAKAVLNNGALTGSLGVVYHPDNVFSFSANVASGFRSPNVDDAGKVFDSEPGSVIVPNPDLEAEYAYNAELGGTVVFGNFLKIDLTGYYTILRNALVRRPFTLNRMDSIVHDGTLSRVMAIQNAGSAFVYGIQAGLELKLLSGFSLVSRFNYQKGEEELDDGTTSPSRHAAPWFGSSRLLWSDERHILEFSLLYNGEKSFDELPDEEKAKDYLYAHDPLGRPYSPSWYTLNLKGTTQLSEVFSLSGGMENITDRRYRAYGSGIAASGRNFILSLKAKF